MTKRVTTADLILERAIEVVEQSGEAGLRVRDLATYCGVTTPIVYRHFGSREGLVVAVQAARYWRSYLEVFEIFDPLILSASTREELYALVESLLNWVYQPERSRFRRMRASVLGSAVNRPELARAIKEVDSGFVERTVELLQPLQQRGLMRSDLPLDAFALWYLGQIDGRIHLELIGVDIDGDHWNDVSRRAILNLIFGHE